MCSDDRAQGNLVVLDHEDHGEPLYRRKVERLVGGPRLHRSVPDPREGYAVDTVHAQGQRQADGDGWNVADVGDRLQHPVLERPHVPVAPRRRGVRRGQVPSQHVGDGHAHLAARPRISDHRRYHVHRSVQSMHWSHCGGLFARGQPRLRYHSLLDPTLEHHVVEARPQHAAIQAEPLLRSKAIHDGLPIGIALTRLRELPDELRVGLPVDVLGRIVSGEPFHGLAVTSLLDFGSISSSANVGAR